VELELSGFFGATPFGAAHLELQFSPNELEIESVDLSGAFEATRYSSEIEPGRVGVTLFNDSALDRPESAAPARQACSRSPLRPRRTEGRRSGLTGSIPQRPSGVARWGPTPYPMRAVIRLKLLSP
jgi:hypothetical protein